MCGIAGLWAPPGQVALPELRARALAMAEAIRSRGPDAQDAWVDARTGLALAHRRLAVVELSPAGAQPMHSASQRWVLVFNGEIYNHIDLRQRLAAPWRGHSDTETLLAGFDSWGVEETVQACTGMFAFAALDRERGELWLGRDRLGEKPLYYGQQGGVLMFASQPKALEADPAFERIVDPDALTGFLRHGYVQAPRSIWRGIAKLAAGTLMCWGRHDAEPRTVRYWSLSAAAARGRMQGNRPVAPAADAPVDIDSLESLISAAVRRQMAADVPLGAFLSGGVDSSTVVALMQSHSMQPIRTFTIGFDETEFDEAGHAAAVARHLGTQHSEYRVGASEALALVPALPDIYDEPFADASQIPTHLVCRMARREVTVALSGDGGDELFAGYNRYVATARHWSRLGRWPRPLRRAAAGLVRQLPDAALRSAATWWAGPDNRGLGARAHLQLRKAAAVLDAEDADALYRRIVSHWSQPERLTGHVESVLQDAVPEGLDEVERMVYRDLAQYLPDDILAKVDRAAMAVSLETRVPLLDHHVVEAALAMPMAAKLRAGVGKWPLRQILYRHVPRTLIERPKMGFSVPIDAWLRGPLRPWADGLLAGRGEAFGASLRMDVLRREWRQFTADPALPAQPLWTALMYLAWVEGREPARGPLPRGREH